MLPFPTDPDPDTDSAETGTAHNIPPLPAVAPQELLPPSPRLPTVAAPPRRRRALRLVLTLLLIAVAGAGGGWWTLLRPLPVGIVHPWHGAAIEAVYATGLVEAVDTARVGTTVAGRIDALLVDEGDRVRRGQVLARLDDREAQQRLSDARARLELAEQELARDQALLQRGVRTPQAEQRSREERDRAAAGVAVAEKGLQDFTIESPLDGIVMTRPVEPGETVAANAVLFTVASPARLRIAADVDERDIPQVRMGARVAIRADAFPGEVFDANVTNIRGQGDAASRTYRVEAELPRDTRLMMGMTVDTNIVVATRADALLVPTAAVRHAPAKGGLPGAAYVFRVLPDGVARRTAVTLGAEGPEAAEVRGGLAADATLVADPPENLKDGMRVRPLAPPRP
ncbi:MAG: efflux RND transporter periplasmic adaptor subunit [Rhodospirillales bacterium]|nr:efflux RND transporter periplasmic adaptor subunit [Rhodospirillales bacterium]